MALARDATKIHIFQFAILFYLFSIFFSFNSGEILVKISRILLLLIWLFTLFRGGSVIKHLRQYYYIWVALFLIYHFIIIQTTAIDVADAFTFFKTVFYTLFINGIILSYLIRDPAFFLKMLHYIPVFSLCGGLRLFLTYGFTYYFNSRGSEINANAPGFALTVGALMALYLFLRARKPSNDMYIYLILAGANTLLAMLTASRMVYVNLGVPILIYMVMKNKNPLKTLRNIIAAVLLVLIAYYALLHIPFLYELIGDRIESLLSGLAGGTTDSSTNTRMKMIQNGLLWFSQKPIWGYGLNGFAVLNVKGGGLYSHNNFIEMLVGGGIVGFAIYYSLYLKILVTGIRRKLHKSSSGIYFMGILIGLIISEYGKVTYYSVTAQLVILLCYFYLCTGRNCFEYNARKK